MKHKSHASASPAEVIGTVLGHRDGHGFVQPDGDQADIYLPASEMRAVLHRDRVRVQVVQGARSGRRDGAQGRVLAIVARSHPLVVGRLVQQAGVWMLEPEDPRYGRPLLLAKQAIGSAKAGQMVVVALDGPALLHAQPQGRVQEVLGDADAPGLEVEVALRKYGMAHEFSDACLALARKLPSRVLLRDKKNRVDLTGIPLVTIDGEDARDFDDAVYCEPASIGKGKTAAPGWRLLVAIADVSHYVQSGSAIDADAYERATSVYFPNRVVPMLPEKLSNGLCSLNPAVERLCMACDMLVNTAGEVVAYQFYPALMRSHARLTYTEVAALLAKRGDFKAQHPERMPDLLNLHAVYQALWQARVRRGAVDFEVPDTQIVCDANGRIEKIVPRVRNDAHKLIEEAMLAANVCSADFMVRGKHLGLFRVHAGPTPEKRELLRNYLKATGVAVTLDDDPTPAQFQAIATATRARADAPQIHAMLLRSMQQAVYTPINQGHFGLALGAYAHFTSPIRRYPDLLVHRVIKAILGQTCYPLPERPAPDPAQAKWIKRAQAGVLAKPAQALRKAPKTSADMKAWQAAGVHCSANERRAEEASRDVQAWLKCKYMSQHVGAQYAGVVSAATGFGVFVMLDDLLVEGLVHLSELGNDYFRFDEARQQLLGERTGTRYAIGTRVQVQVSRVDVPARKIDFRLAPADQNPAPRARPFQARPHR